MVKQSSASRKPAKPTRKVTKKPQKRAAKATPKKVVKPKAKTTKSTRTTKKTTQKKTTQSRAQYLQNISKRLAIALKLSTPPPARKPNKKSQKRTKTTPKKQPPKADHHSSRLLALSVVIAGSLGVVSGHQVWARSYSSLLETGQTAKAPSRVSTAGPSQASPLFSTYPTWSQDFAADSSNTLNASYWNIYKGVPQNDNHEAQYYTDNPTNIHIKNGALSLVATHQEQPQNYQYASARIDTEKKLSFLYGRIDVTAKLPNGVGTWPAIWFLPANTKYEDLSPHSNSLRYLNGGEMDLVEEVGFNPNIEYGVVHTISDQKNPNGVGTYNQVKIPDNNLKYNLYSLLWTPDSITYEVNNTPFFTYNRQPRADYTTWAFDQPFYLILNLAMGGKWGGEDTADFPGNGIDNSVLPASMDIQSIYYYPYVSAQPHQQ